MDGGVQLQALAPDATHPGGPVPAGRGTMDQLRHRLIQASTRPREVQPQVTPTAAVPAGWATLLTARARQAAGLDRRPGLAPSPAGTTAEEGWASRLKAHAFRAGWERVEQARAAMPAVDPIATFAAALQRLRQQLEREGHRADAAEQHGQAAIAAAERRLHGLRAALASREGEVAAAQARISVIEGHLAGALQRAGQAEKLAKESQAMVRRLRSRGLWARIRNAA